MITYKLTAKSAPALTSEQRSKLTKLARMTDADVYFYLRRAVDHFLNDEALRWVEASEAADAAVDAALKTLRSSRGTCRSNTATRKSVRSPKPKMKARMDANSIFEQIRYLDPDSQQ